MGLGKLASKVGSAVLLSLGMMGGSLSAYAREIITRAPLLGGSWQVAQSNMSCRQTNAVTGVYGQPNLDSPSRGILANSQTVRLEVAATGTGWARITEPFVGWVEARYLTPPIACAGINSLPGTQASVPALETAAPSSQINVPPTHLSPSTPQNNPSGSVPNRTAASVTVVCEVLPIEGLVVRRDPTIANDNTLYTIPKGVHQFQFTGNTLTTRTGEVERRWAYITSPYQGWISLGYIGGGFNLGGRECG